MTMYAYSLDEERYHGEFGTVEEALAEAGQEAEDDATEEGEHTRTVWVGEVIEAKDILSRANPIWIGNHILEYAEERLSDEIGWDDTIIELTREQHESLGKLVTEWLCTNATFNAHGIRNVKEHTVKVNAA